VSPAPQSFAGITVPEGEPGGLRSAASQFSGLAGALSGVSGELRGMPGSMGSWQGPASVSFAGSCLTSCGGVDQAVTALGTAEQAARTYADALEEAQDEAERAIEQAREAQQRIDQAQRDIQSAQDRQAAAWQAADAAAFEIAAGSVSGTPSPGALEAQATAWRAADEAAADEVRARRELDRARDDLERAKERGREAEQAARDAARAAAGAFGGAAMASPVWAMFGPGASAAGGGGGSPWWWNTTNEGMQWWNEDQFFGQLIPWHPKNDTIARGKWFVDQAANYGLEFAGLTVGARAAAWRQAARTYTVTSTARYGAMRMTTASGRSLLVSYASRSTTVRGPSPSTVSQAARWTRFGRALPVVGTLAGMGSAAYDQWRQDLSNPNLSTTDRVGRAGGVGVYVGGAAAAGAAIGTFFFPGVGTVAGAAIGAVSGAVAGAVAMSIDPLMNAAADAGQWTANAAVNTYNWAGDRIQDFENAVETVDQRINEGLEAGADWVGDRVSEIDMPEIDMPDIDMPDVDVDLPDVDLPGPF
jgi:uncharacterized protein YukE